MVAKRNKIFVALSLLWLSACSQPVTLEIFAPRGEDLVLDLSDSLCTYDISLFTRSDFPAFTPRTHRDIPLDIVLTSPSGREFSERVFFPTVTPLRSTVFSEDYLALWRTGCNPVEYGEWTLSVRVKDLEWDPHICGVGLIIEKKR